MSVMSGDRYSSHRTQRLVQILDAVRTRGHVHVEQLAADLGVSQATIRRDLAALDHESLLRRTHGGASQPDTGVELPVRYRDTQGREAKQRIAAACAGEVPLLTQAVAIGGGSTAAEVARVLSDRAGLTVVTNSIDVAMILATRHRVRVMVTGGFVRPESYEMVGAWTERFLENLNFSIAIMGVDGISAAGGITTHDPIEARANQRMIARAQRVIIVADRRKVGAVTMAKISDITKVSLLITEDGADPGEVADLRAAGLSVALV